MVGKNFTANYKYCFLQSREQGQRKQTKMTRDTSKPKDIYNIYKRCILQAILRNVLSQSAVAPEDILLAQKEI